MTNLTIDNIINYNFYFFHQEQSDLHLKDYDPEIFDDDDFYHQVTNN